MTLLGAHLSITGGYTNALRKIVEIGGNALQIFSSSPRGWNFARLTEAQIAEFIALKNKLHVHPVYSHASYLINLADNGRIGQLSRQSLKHELQVASKLCIKGSIVHLGSFKNNSEDGRYETLIKNIQDILIDTPQSVLFIIENAGTRKIGLTIDEIARIIKNLDDDRVRVALDTCHLHAVGYSLSSTEKLEKFLDQFHTKIGFSKLELIHLNDSKDPFGSFRDRHENIGEGQVGIETFNLLLNHSQTKHLPFIIETPGFDDKGPDKKNLDRVKSLRI